MKNVLLIALAICTLSFRQEECVIKGKIVDEIGEAAIGAHVKANGTKEIAVADFDGYFSIKTDRAKDTLTVMLLGYKTQKVPVACGTKTLVVKMIPKENLIEEVSVVNYASPLVEPSRTAGGSLLTKSDITKLGTRNISEHTATPTKSASITGVSIRGVRESSTEYYTDGAKVTETSRVSSSKSAKEIETQKTQLFEIAAGTLTAGEVNDFAKWKLWNHLSNEEFAQHAAVWKQNVKHRFLVNVQNEMGFQVADVEVSLLDGAKNIVWKAKTDNTGKAELWAFFDGDVKEQESFSAIVNDGQKIYTINKLKPFSKGINQLKIERVCAPISVADILFAVDATSSMGDELEYLKAELQDIILKVNEKKTSLVLRSGVVMYKDKGDDYVAKHQPFSTDAKQTAQYIQQQKAGGGGDFPEAVDEALNEALHKMNWSSNAVARILFLVLDAPPHNDAATVGRMQQLTRDAAAMGVRIVPVTCSDIDKSTEFLMRSLALATNGTYVFLTDHSGVGNKHLKPSTNEFDVEKLNDLMVRLILQFTYTPSCEKFTAPNQLSKEILTETMQEFEFKDSVQSQNILTDPFGEKAFFENIKFYPNPTNGRLFVEVKSNQVKMLFLTDISGKALEKFDVQKGAKFTVELDSHPAGIYFLRYQENEQWKAGKFLLVKN